MAFPLDREPRRSVRFDYPLSVLFVVTVDLLRLGLLRGELVVVLDFSRKSKYAVIKRGDSTVEVPKSCLRRANATHLHHNYLRALKDGETSFSHAHRLQKSKISKHRNVPLHFEVIGYKTIPYGDCSFTLFFILVSDSEKVYQPEATSNRSFYYTKDNSWIVVKTHQCVMNLHERLEQYLGKGNAPPYKGHYYASQYKPDNMKDDEWSTHRTQLVADFLKEFKNPKRGFYFGNNRHQPSTSDNYMSNPLFEQADRCTDHFIVSKCENNKYLKDCEAYLIDDAPLLADIEDFEREEQSQGHLIHGLIPLINFLHTDKVLLLTTQAQKKAFHQENATQVPSSALAKLYPYLLQRVLSEQVADMPSSHLNESKTSSSETTLVPHYELFDSEVIGAVQNSSFEISPLTPIDSLLKIWSAHRADYLGSTHGSSSSNYNEHNGSAFSAWQADASDDERGDCAEDSSYEHSEDSDSYESSLSSASEGSQKPQQSSSNFFKCRLEKFSERAARATVMGVELSMLRERLLKVHLPSPGEEPVLPPSVKHSISTMKDSLASIEQYISSRHEALEGIESFSRFGLMILSTCLNRSKAAADMDDDDSCSAGSISPAVSTKPKRRRFSILTQESVDHEDTMGRLNSKIQSLLLDWERRRENSRHRNVFRAPEKDTDALIASPAAKFRPHIPLLITYIEESVYRRGSDSTEEEPSQLPTMKTSFPRGGDGHDARFPSLLRGLVQLTTPALQTYLTARSKSLTSRKSDRVVVIERMKKTEKAFSASRLTFAQMLQVVNTIDGLEEKHHASLLLSTKLVDAVEISCLSKLEVGKDMERKLQLIVAVLAAEAQAESHLLEIHTLYLKCFEICQNSVAIAEEAVKKSDLALVLPKSKDGPILSPRMQSDVRSRVKELRESMSRLHFAAAEVSEYLNKGYSLHLTKIQHEQDAILRLTGEFKFILHQTESQCRMRGTLTAGRPEYLTLLRMKAAFSCVETAREITGEVVDEAAGLLLSVQKNLKGIEDAEASARKSSRSFLQQLGSSSSEEGGCLFDSLEEIEKELEDSADGGDLEEYSHQNSISMMTGLTAACAAAGWRRALSEASSENYARLHGIIAPHHEADMSCDAVGEDLEQSRDIISDTTSVCLLLSRLPLLRDMRLASKADEQVEGSVTEDANEGREDEYDGEEDDFSYDIYEDDVF